MNDSWTDYPISVIHWALQSLFGRLIVVVLVITLACGFGVAFADRSISGFFVGLFMFPLIALPGLLVSVGLFVLPITLLFTCMFVIHEWPKWTLALPFVLNLWLAYDYMDYALYRSPDAKMVSVNATPMNSLLKQLLPCEGSVFALPVTIAWW